MRRLLTAAVLIAGIPAPQAAQAQTTPDSGGVASLLARPEVARYLEYFTGPARSRMSQWLTRGTGYHELIASRLDQAGLPGDFAYLPIIESGYANAATSKAGAAGMWQFIPETAREYGLRVDRWVDERRDAGRATDAAIRHIGDLTRRFGSPLLAAAAYNGGSGRVARGLDRLPADSASADDPFFSLAARGLLARETREYVPQLLAAAAIARDPARFGFDVDTVALPGVDSVRVAHPVALAAAEEALGLNRRTLATLNPHFIRGVTPPGGSWLRVPTGYGEVLEERLARLPVIAIARMERRARMGALIRVERGDDLGAVARRHGVDEEALRRANALPVWYRLRAGQALRLPSP